MKCNRVVFHKKWGLMHLQKSIDLCQSAQVDVGRSFSLSFKILLVEGQSYFWIQSVVWLQGFYRSIIRWSLAKYDVSRKPSKHPSVRSRINYVCISPNWYDLRINKDRWYLSFFLIRWLLVDMFLRRRHTKYISAGYTQSAPGNESWEIAIQSFAEKYILFQKQTEKLGVCH